MFAIVDIAGFQEKVEKGDALRVPLLDAKEGDTVTFDQVLMTSTGGDNLTLGTPAVSGVVVSAKVIAHGKGDKIRVFKMKRRKRYRRVHGHRQDYTDIEITDIGGGKKKAEKKEDVAKKPATKKAATKKKPVAKKATTKK